ncbi:MAG TPA: hypothetical protein VEV83_08635 [Parafilimonas sp.]|nr:hypothetical protein [Parafilimonas sp.]
MIRKFLLAAFLLLEFSSAFAHVGSSDVVLEGMAGAYHVLVHIKPPGAIPGTATVTVYVSNGSGASAYARTMYFSYGENGSPSAERLENVTDHPGQFEGIVWLMDNGSASIDLTVDGPLGKGQLLVPVMAVSTTEQKLPAGTAGVLIVFGLFLFVLLITIAGLSVSDAVTKSGTPIPANRKRNRRIAVAIAAVVCITALYAGNLWWQTKAKIYSKYLFRPMHANYQVEHKNGMNELHLAIDTTNSQRKEILPYIVPDHGKIMHLFIIRFPGMDVLAHLHPERTDLLHFTTELPNLPAGRYLAYADVVYNSGFTETMKDTFVVNAPLAKTDFQDSIISDHDDAFALAARFVPGQNEGNVSANSAGRSVSFDGTTIRLEQPKDNSNYRSGDVSILRFSVWDKNGSAVKPDLYMGMPGHAMIVRDDGNVFAHIHPVGTYSMAAQSSLLDRMSLPANEYNYPDGNLFRDSIDRLVNDLRHMTEEERNERLVQEMKMPGMSADKQMNLKMPAMADDPMIKGMNDGDNIVSFPFTFPSAGKYRIWVQVKINGQILTAAFDRNVR